LKAMIPISELYQKRKAPARKKYTKVDEMEIIKLIKAGKTSRYIEDELGCSSTPITNARRKYGLTCANGYAPKKPKNWDELLCDYSLK